MKENGQKREKNAKKIKKSCHKKQKICNMTVKSQKCVHCEKKCKQQAENLHERVKEEYSWGKTVDALLRHFNNQTRRMENMQ